MKGINIALHEYLEAKEIEVAAQEKYFAALESPQEGVDSTELNLDYRAKQRLMEQAAGELIAVVEHLRKINALEPTLERLDEQTSDGLKLALVKLSVEHLLRTSKPTSLEDLVREWKAACQIYDAQRQILDLRRATSPDEFEACLAEKVAAASESMAQPWALAVEAYREAYSRTSDEEQPEERAAQATHTALSWARKIYDRLSEQMIDAISDLEVRKIFRQTLFDLPEDLRDALLGARSTLGARIPQLQPETKPKLSVSVTTTTREEEACPEPTEEDLDGLEDLAD